MLYFVGMTPGKKYTLCTGLFYVLFIALSAVADHFSPGGPCVPGGGLLLLFCTPLISGLGLVICLYCRLKGHRSLLGPFIINGFFFVASLLVFGRGLTA